jgi:hypothetical protein
MGIQKEYYEKERTHNFCGTSRWVKYFQELFYINNERLLVGLYETGTLGPSYIVEWDSDFIKTEVKEFILEMKVNTATGYDGIPAEFRKNILHREGWNRKFNRYV